MSSQRLIPTVDRISALPDSLLCHVLSFLPTKIVVATSVLSKRWKPLWQSVPSLDFHDEGFTDFNTFRHFVYSVIVSRDAMLPIRSFRIKCGVSDNFDPRDLNRFIHAAVQRGLQNFDLELLDVGFYYDLLKFTPTILRVLNCKTLVVLKLTYFSLCNIPHLVDLPLLKTLHLESIVFGIDCVHFGNLVSGCPNLENFYINDVILPDIYNDSLPEFKGFPKLVRAKLFYSEENFPFAWLHNVKFLRAELTSPYEYPVPTFHNLTHIELIFDSEAWPEKWKWVIQVLQHCPKLQSLTIDKDFKNGRVIEEEDWKDPEIVPECLSFRLRTCSLRGFKGDLCELQFAEYIMLNSKLLCTMAIKSICGVDGNAKHQMLVKLSSYPRGSVTCKLLYD